MKLKDLALKTIESGAWTFDLLTPQFRLALERRIRGGHGGLPEVLNRSTMDLTLLAYDVNIRREWQGFGANSKFFVPSSMRSEELAITRAISDKVHAGGVPVGVSPEEIALISNAEVFLGEVAPSTLALKGRWVPSYLKLSQVPFRSASHPHAFGCIFLGEKIREFTAGEVAVSLVHEMAHQELFLFNLLDRLVESDADFKLVHAPFQGTMRPTIGRLHSLYALFRMAEFEKQAGISAARHEELLLATAGTFGPGDLTDYGSSLVSAVVNRIKTNTSLRNAVNA